MPLKRAHQADLPDAIRALSALLTTERYALARSYWSAPRFVSAYLRYFLPWNLLRLHRLFRALPLPAPITRDGAAPLLLDLGSGPLSVPLALWLSSHEWRSAPVRLICVDTAPRPMSLGLELFRKLAGRCREPLNWDIQLWREPLGRALNDGRLRPTLLTGGNVLNEWQEQNEEADDPLLDRLGEVAASVARLLPPSGAALFVEPGTRLGGTLTATLRGAALEEGLLPAAPCTHCGECPLLGRRDRGWCHVHEELATDTAPVWLTSLTQEARLAKQTLSFSYLLLKPDPDRVEPAAADTSAPEAAAPAVPASGTRAGTHPSTASPVTPAPGAVPARVLSDAFLVPDLGFARYACSERGLLLVGHAARLGAGDLISCRLHLGRDAKSGALLAELA